MNISLESPISAYLRASSYIQEDSHERQQTIISKFLLDNKLAIPSENWFSDFRPRDGAAFAKDFQTLLLRIQRGLVKTVIVSNLDRWGTQDVDEFFEFRNILLKGGCKLWSVEDGDLTSKKMGDIITIIVKAEQMREYVRRSAKNIASGKERLAQAGHWTGGKCSPVGYDRLCVDAQGKALWLLHYETPNRKLEFAVHPDGTPDFSRLPRVWEGKRQRPPKNKSDRIRLVPTRTHYGEYACKDKDRVEMVRLLYKWLLTKPWSIRRLARELTELGYRTYGKPIIPQAVINIVENEKYRGDMSYNKRQRAKLAMSVKNVITEVEKPTRTRNGTVKSIKCPKDQWDIAEGTHEGLVNAETWQQANENLQKLKTKKTRRPRSNAYYLRPLLICGHCQKPMQARMEHSGNSKTQRRRYPIYYCPGWADDLKQRPVVIHSIKHSEVEAFIFRRLGELNIEVESATELQDIAELHARYNQNETGIRAFFKTGVLEYLAEVKRFADWAGCPDPKLITDIATVAGHPDWTFGEKGGDPAYDELKTRLKQIDARKVRVAEKRLAELDEEHRAAVRFAMRSNLDERTIQVAEEEVKRLAEERKTVLVETKPFMERYQEKVAELVDFRTRLLALLKTVQETDVDARAVRLMEVLQSVTLFFQPKRKWTETKLDEAHSEVTFNHGFEMNGGTFSPKAFSIGRATMSRIGWEPAAVRGRKSGWRCRWPAQANRAARGAVVSEVEGGRPGDPAVKAF